MCPMKLQRVPAEAGGGVSEREAELWVPAPNFSLPNSGRMWLLNYPRWNLLGQQYVK